MPAKAGFDLPVIQLPTGPFGVTADPGSPKDAGQGPRWGRVPDLLG